MLKKNSELLVNGNPLTKTIIKEFADSLHTGDRIPTIIRIKLWKAGSNFVFQQKLMKVKVINKYPNLVEFEYELIKGNGNRKTVRDTMRWSEMIFGYSMASKVSDRESEKNRFDIAMTAA